MLRFGYFGSFVGDVRGVAFFGEKLIDLRHCDGVVHLALNT